MRYGFKFTKIVKNARVQGTITVYRLLSKLDPAFSFPNEFPASELPEHNLVEKTTQKLLLDADAAYIYIVILSSAEKQGVILY